MIMANHDRKLTPEEKEKLRDFNTKEILRRRFGNPEGAAEAEAEVEAEVAARLAAGGAKCPECGTPYNQRRGPKRCYRCQPKDTARPKPAPVAPAPTPVVTIEPEAAAILGVGDLAGPSSVSDHIPDAGNVVEPEMTPPAPDHVADVGNMVEAEGNGKAVPAPPPVPEYFGASMEIDGTIPDHIADARNMISPDPIAALRRVVDALAGLDDAAALWVLRSARRLPRGGGG